MSVRNCVGVDRRPLRLAAWLLALAFIPMLGHRAAAQEVRGRVVDAGTREPVIGALVTLLDARGHVVQRYLTNEDGLFIVAAPGPGSYRLLTEMIGRRSATSEPFRLDRAQVLDRQLTLDPQPVRLAALKVEGTKRCAITAGDGRAVNVVWEEVRKALSAQIQARAQRLFRHTSLVYTRRLDTRGRQQTEESRYVSGVTEQPFVSRDPAVLARDGYAEISDTAYALDAPDAEVLLSNGFLGTHCFQLTRQDDYPGLIGLAFEPQPGRKLADIKGTLWVDEATAELRFLEFRYVDLPRPLPRREHTGRVDFQRLANGAWIVSSWWIRLPVVTHTAGLRGGVRERFEGYTEDGGRVLHIVLPDGTTIGEPPGGSGGAGD